MSPEQSDAYGKVMKTLDELGPAKLQPQEQQLIRGAADALIFTANLRDDVAARKALREARELCRALVESSRWQEETAVRLIDDLIHCGPEPELELSAV